MVHCEGKLWKSVWYNQQFFRCFTHSAYDFKALEISNNVDDERIVFQNFRVIYCSGSYPLKDGYFFIFSFGKLCISENSNSLQETKDNLSWKGMFLIFLSNVKSYFRQKQSDFNATFTNRCRKINPLRRTQMRALILKTWHIYLVCVQVARSSFNLENIRFWKH